VAQTLINASADWRDVREEGRKHEEGQTNAIKSTVASNTKKRVEEYMTVKVLGSFRKSKVDIGEALKLRITAQGWEEENEEKEGFGS